MSVSNHRMYEIYGNNVWWQNTYPHNDDVIMSLIASQITSLTIVYSTVYLDADQRKHQSSASLAFVRGIHRGPVNSPHKGPVTRKMFPFDDVIMVRWWLATSFLNPLRAKFFRGNINISLHFMAFLYTNKTQVVKIPPRVRQGPAYST